MLTAFLLATAAITAVDGAPAETAAPADAADAAARSAQASPPSATGHDIVVTARRREENVQTIPLAVAVMTDEKLNSTGTFNVQRLTQIQPALTFYSSNPRNTAANIRGLGAPFGLTNDGIEQGVGIYVDQVYYARSASATFDFVDVERVEVLRGPQGTLYGKNTTAGAISITTRAPSFDTEGRAQLSIGNLGYIQAKGSLSGPLVDDKLAARLSFTSTSRNGTIYNVATDSWIHSTQNVGVRGQLLWLAGEDVKITLSGDYNLVDGVCCGSVYVREGATQRPLNRQYAYLAQVSGYAVPSTNPFDRVTDLDAKLNARNESGGVSLRAEWDVGPGTLTSVSAWRYWDWQPSNDRDFIGLPITTRSENPSKQRQWTQEFRYASNGVQKVDYVFGVFFFRQTINTDGVQEQGSYASRWLLSGANAGVPSILDGLRSENDIDFKNTSLAAFGQFTWHATDRLRIQPGLRVNYDKKDGSYVATVTNATGTPLTSTQSGVLAPQSYNPRFSAWNLSGDFTLSYDVAEDVLAYATYARSFKSGGINLSGLPLDAAGQPIYAVETVKPEKVNHFEIGLKTQFWDRRATLNLAGYWTVIDDYQATVTNSQANVIRGYLANAEKVRVRGVELDFALRPSGRWNLYFNGAFTDHRYVRFADAPCPPELSGGSAATATNPAAPAGTPGGPSPANCDISGQWLPGISKWAFSGGAEYNHPITFVGAAGEGFLGADASYRSRWSSNPSRSIYTDVDPAAFLNLRAGFRADKGWEFSGWVRNVTDTQTFDWLATQSGNTGLVIGQPSDPRTWGVTVSTSF